MTKFFLVSDGLKVPLHIVSNMEFGGKQQVVVYESPGTNGGTIITTGRTNNVITLTGRILLPFKSAVDRASPNTIFPSPSNTLNEIKATIQKLRDKGKPIQLIAPVDNDDSGQYIIEDFRANLPEGSASYLPFTITLQEFRQANIQRSAVNLVNYTPGQIFIQRLKDRNLLVASQ